MDEGATGGRGEAELEARALTNAPVKPMAQPHRETVFGHEVEDEYRWMEGKAGADEVSGFLSRSGAHTAAQLAALPGRARLRERVAAGMRSGVRYRDVREVDGILFFLRLDPDAQYERLVMRSDGADDRVLYDPRSPEHPAESLQGYTVSPDASTVAISTAGGGGEVGAVRFLDVSSGEPLADRLEPVFGELPVAWLDERTVAYTLITGYDEADPLQHMQVMTHRLGVGEAACLLGSDALSGPKLAPHEFPIIEAHGGSDWVVGYAVGARADARVFVARRSELLSGVARWREIATYADQVAAATALRGETLYLCTTKTMSTGEVVAIDLAAGGGLEGATLVLARSDLIVTEWVAANDGLYVLGRTDGASRLFHLGDGRQPAEIELPMRGSAGWMRGAGTGGGVTFTLADWFTATRGFRAFDGAVVPIGLDSASFDGLPGASQIRRQVTSADGTEVPLVILLPGDIGPGPAPAFLDAYGSYGFSITEPFYATRFFGLLASGGIVVLCGTRGGGERGRAWHDAGRAGKKPNAHADLIAAATYLIESGLTRADMMTVTCTSAGGLLGPPVALARPDLFAGLVARVAILNPSRLGAAQNGANQFAEMGDPGDEAGFTDLLRQDAYHLLASAQDMPDTLLTVGLNDPRVEPWMTAKFAARALERFGDRRLVLIRTDHDAGHGIGSGVDQFVDEWTDLFAFVLNRAGVDGFTLGAASRSGRPTRPKP